MKLSVVIPLYNKAPFMACGISVFFYKLSKQPTRNFGGRRFGTLTPVRDSEALAEAIEKALGKQTSPNLLIVRVMEFSIEKKTDQCLELFFRKIP